MFAEDLKSYIKAGQPLLYVTALELPRAAYSIETICKSLNGEGYPFHEWKVTTGWDGTGNGDDPGWQLHDGFARIGTGTGRGRRPATSSRYPSTICRRQV